MSFTYIMYDYILLLGGYLELRNDGELRLVNGDKKMWWRSGTTSMGKPLHLPLDQMGKGIENCN